MHKDLNKNNLEEIAKQIADGLTSGILNDGEGKQIAWQLSYDVWKEGEE